MTLFFHLKNENDDLRTALLEKTQTVNVTVEALQKELAYAKNQLNEFEGSEASEKVSIDDELALLENENDDLKSALLENTQSVDVTVEALQQELANAKNQLKKLEEGQVSDRFRCLAYGNETHRSDRLPFGEARVCTEFARSKWHRD